MNEQGKKLLSLMFRPGETVCVSHNKYGYHSIPLENAMGNSKVTLVPTPDSCAKRDIEWNEDAYEYADTNQLLLIALNPIKGFREDVNAYKFRNFLIEMDYGPLAQQMAYAKQIGLPYSAVVFSGNKSLHFLVSLDTDLPNENVYRVFSEWILNVMTLADQNTKNPSRSIRIPGVEREPGKKQLLVDIKGPTKMADMVAWLNQFPDSKPKLHEKREISADPDISKVKDWVAKVLVNGITRDRNKQWFTVACEFALAGYSEDDTIDKLGLYFVPDRDFKEREWKTAIHSAFKYIYSRK